MSECKPHSRIGTAVVVQRGFIQPAPATPFPNVRSSLGAGQIKPYAFLCRSTMTFSFSLCRDCLAKYNALRFEPACTYSLNVMPLCSLVWPDEHPERWFRECCEECQESMRRLAHVRTHFWRANEFPDDYRAFWAQAQRTIPNWPGFGRLSLNEEQLKSLAGCGEELNDFMGAVAEDFPATRFTDQGGGLSKFTASREQDEAPRKQWWQFWK
jgi:hypothetical protein